LRFFPRKVKKCLNNEKMLLTNENESVILALQESLKVNNLIKSGGGTGPRKPRQPALQGAKSDEFAGHRSDIPVFVLRQMRSDFFEHDPSKQPERVFFNAPSKVGKLQNHFISY